MKSNFIRIAAHLFEDKHPPYSECDEMGTHPVQIKEDKDSLN